jgi:hypothetical protein
MKKETTWGDYEHDEKIKYDKEKYGKYGPDGDDYAQKKMMMMKKDKEY